MCELVRRRERLSGSPARVRSAVGAGRQRSGEGGRRQRVGVLSAAALSLLLCTAIRAEVETPGAPTLRWVTTGPATAEIRADGITNGGTPGNGAISWDVYFRFPASVNAPLPVVSIVAGPAWTGMSPCGFATNVTMNLPSAAGATGTRGVLINGFCTTGVPTNPVTGSDVLVATVTFASCPAGGAFVIDVDSGNDVFGTSVADVVDRNNDPFNLSDAGLADGTALCVPGIPDVAVDPVSLASLQAVDTQAVLPFDIANHGTANLVWTIAEDTGLGGSRVVVEAPGRLLPILPHRRSAPPEENAFSLDGLTLSRATALEAGEPAPQERSEVPDGSVTLTHSASRSLVAGNSISCNSGGEHASSSYLRYMNLADFGIDGAFDVSQVEVGIEDARGAGGIQPVTVNLYTWDPLEPFRFENFVPIGSANGLVPDQSLALVTIPVSGSAPAGSTLVVELVTPDGQSAHHSLRVGSNAGGQTAPSYLAAADCGLPEPTSTGALGFPAMELVILVTGTATCTADLPWASASPAAGTTVPFAASAVDVTLDSTGLTPGGVYTGALCIESNDPDSPTVLVPLTLTVDSLPFLDGFETGDTLRWSLAVP